MKCFIGFEPNGNYAIIHAKNIKEAITIFRDMEKTSNYNEYYYQITEIVETWKRTELKTYEKVWTNKE